ncbi:hypothetical protein ACIRG8_04130 [Streptomyces sp. NPDC102359]|uniref:hypothetical protein n=2 Tax=Streptomyces TaxID=1883 RepID=UPI00381751BC
MDVPLWFALIVVGWLGVKLVRPPWWLIAVLLLGGFLLADSVLAPVIDSAVKLRRSAHVPAQAPDHAPAHQPGHLA